MKKSLLLLFVCAFAFVNAASAQSRLKESDLKGTWKLVIELDESEGDGVIERAVLGAVDGLISSFDISMQFERDNELKVVINLFGEEEVEYTSWKIQDGALYLGDNEHLDMEDTVWYLSGDRLIAYDKDEDSSDHSVYLERVY